MCTCRCLIKWNTIPKSIRSTQQTHTLWSAFRSLSIYPDQLYCWSFATTFCKNFDWHKVNKFTSCPFFKREIQRSRAHITCAIFFLKWDYLVVLFLQFSFIHGIFDHFFSTQHIFEDSNLKIYFGVCFFYCDFAVSVAIFATWTLSTNKCQYFKFIKLISIIDVVIYIKSTFVHSRLLIFNWKC